MLLNIEQTGEPPKSLPHPVCEEKPNPFHFPFKIRRRWLRCGQGGTCSASWTPNSRRVKGLVVRGGESDSFGVDQFDIEIHLNWRKSDDDVKNKHVSFCALSDSRIHKLNEQRNEFSVIIYWVVEKENMFLGMPCAMQSTRRTWWRHVAHSYCLVSFVCSGIVAQKRRK